jgi:IclR family transcriptional regulator, pca regulon regulatory protein
MAGRGAGPDFVEALARGLDVLTCFGAEHRTMTLTEVASATQLARPTARRLLLTLEELGFVRSSGGAFELTPKVLSLGMAYIGALNLWDIAEPHLKALVARTGEPSTMTQLDGSDILYVAHVAVPKIIALRVGVGSRFPAAVTAMGKVLLASLAPEQLRRVLAQPSRSTFPVPVDPSLDRLEQELAEIRDKGWALSDKELASDIRSVAVPVRDRSGTVRAAVNVTVHAAETSMEHLLREHLPRLVRTAADISADWSLWQSRPHLEVARSGDAAPDEG